MFQGKMQIFANATMKKIKNYSKLMMKRTLNIRLVEGQLIICDGGKNG